MLNIYTSAKYFTKQLKFKKASPVWVNQECLYLQPGRAAVALELSVTPQQLKYNPRVMRLDRSRLSTRGCSWATRIPALQREWGQGKRNQLKLLRKTACGTFALSCTPKLAAVCSRNPDSHFCLLSAHDLQILYRCPDLVSLSHMK